MSTETADDELNCRVCGEPFGNPGALATHERSCTESDESPDNSEETGDPPEPEEPPFVVCKDCGRRIPWEPVVESYAWRSNHLRREHGGGGQLRDHFEWVGTEDVETGE